jgi:hypothetical protein
MAIRILFIIEKPTSIGWVFVTTIFSQRFATPLRRNQCPHNLVRETLFPKEGCATDVTVETE